MLFKWFKKKDKIVPLTPLDSGPENRGDRNSQPIKAGKPFAHSAKGKPFGRPVMAGAKKPAPVTKDTSKINRPESSIIRIGKLGEVLLQYNMISRENLEKALEIQQKSFVPSGPQDNAVQTRKLLGEILIENNLVTEEQLLSAFARHCRIPYIKLNKYGLPKEAIKSVPEDLILKHKVMPVDKIGSMLMLAVTDPYDTNAVEEVKTRTGLKVKTILCKQSEFAEMVKFYYPHANEKPVKTPADTPAEATAPDAPANPEPPLEPQGAAYGNPAINTTHSEPHSGDETSVFNIEELPFPEPPAAQSAPADQPAEDEAIYQEQAAPLPNQPPLGTAAENIDEAPAEIEASAHEENPAAPDDRPAEMPEAEEKQAEPAPENIPAENSESIPRPAELSPAAEDKKESFLGEDIEETVPDNLPATADLPEPQPADAAQTEINPEPAPEITPQPFQAQESENPVQPPPETNGVNGYDTSLIDIQDLITAQQNSPDEKIEIIPEEPADVAPYIYPTYNPPVELPSIENPINGPLAEEVKKPEDIPASQTDIDSQATPKEKPVIEDKKPVQPDGGKSQLQATSAPLPDPGKPENKSFEENPVPVSEDEFLIAQQLFTAQLAHSWEKLYHRSKPSRAEKVGEYEFAFYTETSVH